MKDNTRTAIGYICITFCFLGWMSIFWALNLANAELTINLNTDNNTLDSLKSMEKTMEKSITKKCYAITHEVWGVWDVRENIIYNRTVDTGFDWEEVRCPHEFIISGVSE